MTDEQPQSQRHRSEQGEAFHDEPGNTYITFGDGTGAVHTVRGWIMVQEDECST